MIKWQLDDRQPSRVLATVGGKPANWTMVLESWQAGAGVALAQCLAQSALAAAYFECEALTRSRLSSPFRAVLLAAPTLAKMRADHRPFRQLFLGSDTSSVIAFDSLGKDARLIAPRPDGRDYGHLLSFLRTADEPIIAALFRRLASEIVGSLDDQPRWISTSGLGVAWLHVRIDRRPKYYQYAPYRTPPPS